MSSNNSASLKPGVFISQLQWKLLPRSTENPLTTAVVQRHAMHARYMLALQCAVVRDKEMANENEFLLLESCLEAPCKEASFHQRTEKRDQTQPLVSAQGRRDKLSITLTDSRHLAKGLSGSLRDKLEPWALVRSASFA